MHVSPLPDKSSTKFQRLYLCFRGPASDWDPREYYAAKPEVYKTNMAASKLEMHVSPLPDKISTKYQRLYLCFQEPSFHKNQRECYATKPEVEKSKVAAYKFKMHVSSLPDKILAKFQRLYLYFRGPAFHWDLREYYATKPEVENTNMAASKLAMHVSPLTDEISTKFQRLYLCFRGPAFHWDPREYYATTPEVEKPIWRTLNFKCMFLRSQTRYQQNSNLRFRGQAFGDDTTCNGIQFITSCLDYCNSVLALATCGITWHRVCVSCTRCQYASASSTNCVLSCRKMTSLLLNVEYKFHQWLVYMTECVHTVADTHFVPGCVQQIRHTANTDEIWRTGIFLCRSRCFELTSSFKPKINFFDFAYNW